MTGDNNKITKLEDRKTVEIRPGLFKTNLSYNRELMMCRFLMKKGASIELHNHAAVQNGYIISGKILFQVAGADMQVAGKGELEAGAGYVWDSMEYHSFTALEDSEFIECFTPTRPEYIVEAV